MKQAYVFCKMTKDDGKYNVYNEGEAARYGLACTHARANGYVQKYQHIGPYGRVAVFVAPDYVEPQFALTGIVVAMDGPDSKAYFRRTEAGFKERVDTVSAMAHEELDSQDVEGVGRIDVFGIGSE